MKLLKAYHYLFYKLYKFSEAAPSRWWSEWKASLAIDVLIFAVLLSAGGYYTVISKKDMLPVSSPKIAISLIVVAVVGLNYFIFNHRDKWKLFVNEFEQWSKVKNRIGGIIVWVGILLIIANLIFMFYLLSKIDWQQYR